LSNTSNIRFDNSGESGPPCGVPFRRTDQTSFEHTRGQKTADQLQDALVSDPLGNEPHQDVVIDPVEELLQVDIYNDGVTGRDIGLRLLHRLMRRAPRPKAKAHLGERSVPVRLQHLHHRLLDEAVKHRRNAQRSHAA
jgi:site-specific DNA recombinase